MKGSGKKEDPLIIYSDNEEEYDTTNKLSANSKSITGATICGSRSPTYMPALDDNTVKGYCSSQSSIVEMVKSPNENTIIKDSFMTEVFDMVNQQRNHTPKIFVSSMIMGKETDEGEGGCSARALKSLNVFKTVKLAKNALNIQIAAVEQDFCNRRKNNIGEPQNNIPSAGITDEEWHVETIKRTICNQIKTQKEK